MAVQETSPIASDGLLHQLNIQSRQINNVLHAYDLPAEVSGGVVRQNSVSFDLQTHLAGGLEMIRGLKADLMAALGVRDVVLMREGGQWQVHVERAYEPAVPLLRLMEGMPRLAPATLPLGLRGNGAPFTVTLGRDAISHVLVSGVGGAGKTALLRSIASGLAFANRQADLQLLLVDGADALSSRMAPKESLRPLAYLPHMLTDPVFGPEAGSDLLGFLADEMDHRRAGRVSLPVLVALVDHAATLLDRGSVGLPGIMMRLLQHGAEAGIHLVLATSRPGAACFDAMFRANVPLRIVGKAAGVAEARQATGLDESYAEYLMGSGDFLAVADGSVTRFQAAYVGDYDLHHRLSQIFSMPRPRLLAQPFAARPQLSSRASTPFEPQVFTFRNEEAHVQQSEPAEDPLPFFDDEEE